MRLLLAVSLLALACAASAQTAYRWTDKDGKVHYADQPPPPSEASKVEKKPLVLLGADPTAPYALRQAMADFPVTLYTQTGCGDPCKEARDYLMRRGTPFTDKIVVTAADVAALRQLLGGAEATVPVMQVGLKVAKGYLRSEWDSLLDAAGYPKAAARPDAATPRD
jgi:hypothetical protein